jgi:hypothetical protein
VGGLQLADLLRLLAAADEPTEHLRKLFEWQVERTLTSMRLMAGAVGAILVALVAALLRDDAAIADWLLVLVVASSILGGAYTWSRYEEARRLEREYVAALNLLRELGPLAPLLRLSPHLYVD